MVDVEIGAIAELDHWYGEHGELLVGIFESTACVERCQISAATEATAHAELLGLTDVEGVGPGVGNCEAGVVILVVVDVVVGEVGDSDVDAGSVRIGTRLTV